MHFVQSQLPGAVSPHAISHSRLDGAFEYVQRGQRHAPVEQAVRLTAGAPPGLGFGFGFGTDPHARGVKEVRPARTLSGYLAARPLRESSRCSAIRRWRRSQRLKRRCCPGRRAGLCNGGLVVLGEGQVDDNRSRHAARSCWRLGCPRDRGGRGRSHPAPDAAARAARRVGVLATVATAVRDGVSALAALVCVLRWRVASIMEDGIAHRTAYWARRLLPSTRALGAPLDAERWDCKAGRRASLATLAVSSAATGVAGPRRRACRLR